ncbi:hypothetical protein XELAEV_18044551mg [Xenopus laevis]|uniref:Uncharacterized protein n=1 Tax=Xenopus laevis TaxID=8355 RepID=A0A974H3C7_XENLA|nr:hypothetical protein XELAEV_18044551mg [Xenopus laevis]
MLVCDDIPYSKHLLFGSSSLKELSWPHATRGRLGPPPTFCFSLLPDLFQVVEFADIGSAWQLESLNPGCGNSQIVTAYMPVRWIPR